VPYRRTERVEARLAGNRQRILRTARQLMAEGGFREARVTAIAAAAGVATGTIYRYFPSKAELFAEVLRVICQRELDVVSAIADSGGPARDRLAAAVRAFTSRALRGRRLAYTIIIEPVDPEVDQVRLEYRRAQGRVFESIIADGIGAGEFPPQNVKASAACLVGAFLEGLVGPLGQDAGVDDEAGRSLIEAIVGFALRAVSGGEIAREQARRAAFP
jgi:AcrR family transcriptional regulator